MKKQKYILIVPEHIYTIHLEDFILQKLHMELNGDGFNSIKYISNRKPRRLKERILKNFGTCVWNRIIFFKGDEDYENQTRFCN